MTTRKVIIAAHIAVVCGLLVLLGDELFSRRPPTGLVRHDPIRASSGYTLYCSSKALVLIDMQGKEIFQIPQGSDTCQIPSSGRIAALHEKRYVEHGPDGSVLRSFQTDNGHHAFASKHPAHVYILTRHIGEFPGICDSPRTVSEGIHEYDRAGKIIWSWHLNDHARELEKTGGIRFPFGKHSQKHIFDSNVCDWSHLNAVSVLPHIERYDGDRRFRAGNLLISLGNSNLIAVIERSTGKVVWAWGNGILDRQHDPYFLPNGHILVFDNGFERKWSRVLEIDPLRNQIIRELKPTTGEFFTPTTGSSQLLPNGNILAVLGDYGRLVEFTPAGRRVWEYLSPGIGTTPRGMYRDMVNERVFPGRVMGSARFQFRIPQAHRYTAEQVKEFLP